MFTKNTAITGFTFGLIHKVTGEAVTAGTATGYITINGGTQAELTNTPVHEGNGQWSVNLTAAETNGEIIGLAFTHSSAVPCYFTIKTTSGGVNSVLITVDDGVNPILGVDVAVYDSTNAVYITGGKSNSSGQLTLYLDDGTYSVRLRKVGVDFTNPETLTVSGDTEETFSGETVSVGVPADSDTCRVYEYCYNQAGTNPLSSVTAYATIESYPYDYDGKLHYSLKVAGTYDSTTGLVYWDIVVGCVVLFKITELGMNYRKTIPDEASARISSIED